MILRYQARLAANKATLIKETNTIRSDARRRRKTRSKSFQDWAVGVDYREDVYKAVKAFEDTNPKLTGEDAKAAQGNDARLSPRRTGSCRRTKRKEVEKLRKELAKLGTDFDTNIVNAQAPVVFTKAELEGVPDSFLASPGVKTGDDAYTVMANVTWQYITVMENAKSEADAQEASTSSTTRLAKEKNVRVLNQMLALRNKIALRLGYKSWDDFQTEIKMAKSGAPAPKITSTISSPALSRSSTPKWRSCAN